jgi:hypothetical protein
MKSPANFATLFKKKKKKKTGKFDVQKKRDRKGDIGNALFRRRKKEYYNESVVERAYGSA